jgi:hypothetical protein
VAIDGAGNLYVADLNNTAIRKVTPAGVVTTVAGSTTGGTADGTGAAAQFIAPTGIAVDHAGNLFVADFDGRTIRKITPGGVVTTFAGQAAVQGVVDGVGTAARFDTPIAVAIDSADNLFVADLGGNVIRKITPAGVVTTVAGVADVAGYADGAGALFDQPTALAVDGADNLYVTDLLNHAVRKVTPAGAVTTVLGNPGVFGIVLGTPGGLAQPRAITVDGHDLVVLDADALLAIRGGAN